MCCDPVICWLAVEWARPPSTCTHDFQPTDFLPLSTTRPPNLCLQKLNRRSHTFIIRPTNTLRLHQRSRSRPIPPSLGLPPGNLVGGSEVALERHQGCPSLDISAVGTKAIQGTHSNYTHTPILTSSSSSPCAAQNRSSAAIVRMYNHHPLLSCTITTP